MIDIKPHVKYAFYVFRHKWFVFVECVKLGLIWRGIVHDLDKFLPSMWFPYVNAFYGKHKPSPRDNSGYYDATKVGSDPFMLAWLGHIHRNKHHWQYWVLLHDDGGKSVFPMPDKYRKEMLSDWRGAGRAQGSPDTRGWYDKNRDKMILNESTRNWIEANL